MTPFELYKERLAELLKEADSPTLRKELTRHLSRTDLWFLVRHVLNRKDVDRPWLWERCCEVQDAPDGYLDLWAREHYKSTVITFGKTIQDILRSHGEKPLDDRECCVGIFSHTRPIAKAFLRQIKQEFEGNVLLQELFPDVLWSNPRKEAPKWSEDDGITVRRKGNPKEQTIEAWGLVDGQPTSKHFTHLVYDDVVTKESVTTPEMIEKTTDALALSYNLGAHGGVRRFIGTRYHFNDTYRTVLERQSAIPRLHAATNDGSVGGVPVLLTEEQLADKRRDQGPYIFSCQMLQNPVADSSQGFKEDWLRYYEGADHRKYTIYILVDAANEKRKTSDYTAIWVIGLGSDQNYYALDIVRDRLNLTERAKKVMQLHRKYKPKEVRYEKYGLMADVQHLKTVMEQEEYRFDIVEVGGQTPKNDRIKRPVPVFEQHRFYLPHSLHYTNYEGKAVDLVRDFTQEEYLAFPVPLHDDLLDALARIEEPDLTLAWPKDAPKPLVFAREF